MRAILVFLKRSRREKMADIFVFRKSQREATFFWCQSGIFYYENLFFSWKMASDQNLETFSEKADFFEKWHFYFITSMNSKHHFYDSFEQIVASAENLYNLFFKFPMGRCSKIATLDRRWIVFLAIENPARRWIRQTLRYIRVVFLHTHA